MSFFLELAMIAVIKRIIITIVSASLLIIAIRLFLNDKSITIFKIIKIAFFSNLLGMFFIDFNPFFAFIVVCAISYTMFRHEFKTNTQKAIIFTVVWLMLNTAISFVGEYVLNNVTSIISPKHTVFEQSVVKMENKLTQLDINKENSSAEDILSFTDGAKIIKSITEKSLDTHCDNIKNVNKDQYNYCIDVLSKNRREYNLCDKMISSLGNEYYVNPTTRHTYKNIISNISKCKTNIIVSILADGNLCRDIENQEGEQFLGGYNSVKEYCEYIFDFYIKNSTKGVVIEANNR